MSYNIYPIKEKESLNKAIKFIHLNNFSKETEIERRAGVEWRRRRGRRHPAVESHALALRHRWRFAPLNRDRPHSCASLF